MSRNYISIMRTFYLSIVGCTFLLLYAYTEPKGTKPCILEVVYMCLQESLKIRNCCVEYWSICLRSYQADLERKPSMCVLTRQKKRYGDVCQCYPTSPRSCSADRDIFPLCQDAVSEVGKSGYPGGLITRRAVSTFAKLQVAVSSNQPLATTFFQIGILSFQCHISVTALSGACVL